MKRFTALIVFGLLIGSIQTALPLNPAHAL